MPPGSYRVQASLSGFRKTQTAVTVGLDATATANLVLQPSATEDVVVHGELPFVDVTSTMVATGYTRRVIDHLPCDRDYSSIVSANPGVNVDRGKTQLRAQALAIKGATSAENQWIVDGVNTTDVQRGIQGKAINNEFIQEVEVKTGGYQAEYGRALGGIINVVTRSGGNDFHGDAFFYYDSSSWQADQKFTSQDSVVSAMRIADYERRDFGADLGGYLLRDRLWFFAAYDRVEFPAEVSRVVSTPLVSSEDRFPLDAVTNLYSAKLTWNIGPSTSAVASVFADPTSNEGAGAADPRLGQGGVAADAITYPDPSTWYSTRFVGGTDYGLRVTQLLGPAGLLAFQGGRHQDRFELTAPDGARRIDLTCSGGTAIEPCPRPSVPNIETGGYGFIYGARDAASSHRGQYRVDGTVYAGNHTVKAGGDYQSATSELTDSFTGRQLVRIFNERGTLYYQHRFYPTSYDDWTPVAEHNGDSKVRDIGVYLQDSWTPGPGWTVNAGLRWDEERIGSSGLASFIETDRWQPRLGVAWDPWRDGKTRIYAFAGRFSWGLSTDLPARVLGGSDAATTFNYDPIDVAPVLDVPGHKEEDWDRGASLSPELVDDGLTGIYQDEVNLGLERQFDPTLTVGLVATYRRLGNSIEDRCDLDAVEENNFNTCAIINPGSDGKIARGDVPWCNGLEGDLYQCFETGPALPAARRLYRGIEVLARKTVSDGLWLQASYVFSSLRGNYDGAISENTGQTDPGINADFDYAQFSHNNYGRLFLDRPHRFRFDGYYNAPFGVSVGLQAFAASGVPQSKLGYFNSSYLQFINLVPRGYAARLPMAWDANLTLSYPVAVGPVIVTLQGYVYNVFNNQIPVWQDVRWSTDPPKGYPETIYDPNQEQTNPEYGKVVSRQDPRLFRAAIRISF